MRIVKDKDLIYETDNYDVILIGTSIYCCLDGGFQSKMKYKYKYLEPENDKTPYADTRKLGKRLTLSRENDPIISLMYICGYPMSHKTSIDYDALEKCLIAANAEFRGKKIAMTIPGCTKFDGNGDREKCLDILNKCMSDADVTVYDYQQKGRQEEIFDYIKYIDTFYKTDREKYKKLKSEFTENLKKQYLK